jgi:hypothetical protein
MGLFNRSKTSENIKKKETFVDNVKDFKSNIVNKESVEQQDLFSNKSTDTISNKSTLGTKRGLSYNFEKIEKKHLSNTQKKLALGILLINFFWQENIFCFELLYKKLVL